MESIFSQHVIDTLQNLNYLNAQTVFIKTPRHESNIYTVVAINESNGVKRYSKMFDGLQFDVYQLGLTRFKSLILEKNIIIRILFASTVCLKDELDIGRNILLFISQIEQNSDSWKGVRLPDAWNMFGRDDSYSCKELTILFQDVTSDVNFYKNVLVPLLSSVSEDIYRSSTLLQFYMHNNQTDASYTIFVNDKNIYSKLLDNLQNYLYLHSLELKLRNIKIPYPRKNYDFESISDKLLLKISDFITLVQSEVIANSSNEDNMNSFIITYITYVYFIMAKIFYKNISEFRSVNNNIFKRLLMMSTSDTLRYVLNNNAYGLACSKIEKEYQNLSIANAEPLFANYDEMICDWNNVDEKTDTIVSLKKIKSFLPHKSHDKDKVFEEMSMILFSSFGIFNYFKSYIPYTFKFLTSQ